MSASVRRQAWGNLKREVPKALGDWLFGNRDFTGQPDQLGVGVVQEEQRLNQQRPQCELICRIPGVGTVTVLADLHLARLINVGQQIPIVYQVSRYDKHDLVGRIDFSRLRLEIKN